MLRWQEPEVVGEGRGGDGGDDSIVIVAAAVVVQPWIEQRAGQSICWERAVASGCVVRGARSVLDLCGVWDSTVDSGVETDRQRKKVTSSTKL